MHMGDAPLSPARSPQGWRRSEDIVDDYYARHYAAVHGSGCLGGAADVLHERLERLRPETQSYPLTVEVGAGRYEHYPFVKHARTRYVATDIRSPSDHAVPESSTTSTSRPDLEFVRMDALQLAFADHSVDRVVASCLLIHLPDPYAAVHEWQRVCRPDGVIDMLVPCDPGLVARGFRRFVSQRVADRQNVAREHYALVNAIEHLSPFNRVLTLTRAAIEPDRRLSVRYFPFPMIPSWNLNAFAVLSIGPA